MIKHFRMKRALHLLLKLRGSSHGGDEEEQDDDGRQAETGRNHLSISLLIEPRSKMRNPQEYE